MCGDNAPAGAITRPLAQDNNMPVVHVGFWQRPVAQTVVPLAVSLVVHLSLICLGMIGYRSYRRLASPPDRQIIIPEAAMIEGAPVGIPNPGDGGVSDLPMKQSIDGGLVSGDPWAQKPAEGLTAALMGNRSLEQTDSVIGLGPGTELYGGIGPVQRTGGGAGAAPFGAPAQSLRLGTQSPFMGISGNARRVVYICDASGSMMDVFWRVKLELRKAVDVLKPMQAFNVIFFSDAEVTALSEGELVMATAQNKRRAFELAETMSAAGMTDPLPAIRLAFEQKPELIYVLTDGFDQAVSFQMVIDEFRRLNADKKVTVNTVMIRGADNPELEKVVRTIAAENGGICRIVDPRNM